METETSTELDVIEGESWVSLAEISRQLDVSYERLRGFSEATGVSELLGATKRGGKGLKFPSTAIESLRSLIKAQDEGAVTPRTAAAWLQNRTGAIVPIEQKPQEMTSRELAMMIMRIVPPQEDRLLSVKEARDLFGISDSAARSLAFKEGGKIKVKKSSVLAYISKL